MDAGSALWNPEEIALSERISPAQPPYDERTLRTFDRLPKDWGEPFLMFRVLARDSRLLERYINGAAAYIDPSHITVRQREVFLLRVTGLCRCAYEWNMRVHYFAAAAGLSDAQVRATAMNSASRDDWTDEDRLLLALAEELHETSTISDALWARLEAAFTDEAVIQLLMIAGHYRTTAYFANGLRYPIEPGIADVFATIAA